MTLQRAAGDKPTMNALQRDELTRHHDEQRFLIGNALGVVRTCQHVADGPVFHDSSLPVMVWGVTGRDARCDPRTLPAPPVGNGAGSEAERGSLRELVMTAPPTRRQG